MNLYYEHKQVLIHGYVGGVCMSHVVLPSWGSFKHTMFENAPDVFSCCFQAARLSNNLLKWSPSAVLQRCFQPLLIQEVSLSSYVYMHI